MKIQNKEYKNILDKYLNLRPFDLNRKQKLTEFKNGINALTEYHYKNNKLYKEIVRRLNFKLSKKYKIDELPFLPVTVFKNFDILHLRHVFL